MMNEPEVGEMRQEDYCKDWVMHIGKILREEDDGGRVMVMSDDERMRPGERTEIRLWRYAG